MKLHCFTSVRKIRKIGQCSVFTFQVQKDFRLHFNEVGYTSDISVMCEKPETRSSLDCVVKNR